MAKNSKDNKDRGLINPFIDWSFKYLFGREETKDLLIGFLNVLLKRETPISDITYLNNEHIGDDPELKACVFDVLCTDTTGDRFLVEMQRVDEHNIRNRLLYYACRLIDEMGRRGDWEYDLDRVYAICLMDFTYADEPVLRNDYMLMDASTGRLFSDRLNIITLQIPCIKAKSLSECRESYEKCLFLLKAMQEGVLTFQEICEEIEHEYESEEVKAMLRRVAQAADRASLSPAERVAYDYALKRYRDYYSGIKTAEEKGREEGLAEGLAEGHKEGRKEGRIEGHKEGLVEGEDRKMREIAKAMKAGGESAEKISLYTGLSIKEVEEL